jgi:mono/diheme cytochrome c family protein
MTRRSFQLMLPGFLLVPVVAAYAGGWAVITVEELPDYVRAGQPVPVTFTVRQHGRAFLSGLRADVAARAGNLTTKAATTAGSESGQYTATLTFPQPGEWAITIHSGFMNSMITLLPMKAIEAGTPSPAPLPEMERGRRLFVAKGCVTCHVRSDVKASGSVAAGPDLTGKRYPPEFLAQVLAKGGSQMPNLNLKQQEIASLVAFINTETQALR